MAESDSALEAMLVAAVKAIWHSPDRDQLTVNNVYKRAEADNGLGDRYFKDEARKDQSKAIVKATVDELNDLAESDAEQPLSNAPSDKDEGDDEEEETKQKPPKKKRITKKSKPAPARGRKRKASSEDDEDDDESEFSEPEVKTAKVTGRKRRGTLAKSAKDNKDGAELSGSDADAPDASAAQAKKADDDDSSSLSSVVIDEEPPAKQPKKSKKAAPADEAGNDSDSLSSVIDDGPPAKKKAKTKASAAKKGATGTSRNRKSSATGGAAAAAEDVSPADAEIKKLQAQLVKCGVRKIWGIELKKYGDDTRAKVQHLREMLKEIGMDGRFSEAKAREIKEKRELAKELEAVTEMNDLWGSTGRRARRNAAPKRTMKEDSEEANDEEEENEQEGEDEDDTGSSRRKKKGRRSAGADGDGDGDEGEDSDALRAGGRRRVRPELAFLGDESDSD